MSTSAVQPQPPVVQPPANVAWPPASNRSSSHAPSSVLAACSLRAPPSPGGGSLILPATRSVPVGRGSRSPSKAVTFPGGQVHSSPPGRWRWPDSPVCRAMAAVRPPASTPPWAGGTQLLPPNTIPGPATFTGTSTPSVLDPPCHSGACSSNPSTITPPVPGLDARAGGMIVTKNELRAEFAKHEGRLMMLLKERLDQVDEKLARLEEQVEDQATSLFTVRDDSGATKVEVESKMDLLESIVNRRFQEVSVDIEERLSEAATGTSMSHMQHMSSFERLRLQVEDLCLSNRDFKESVASAEKRRVLSLGKYLFTGNDRGMLFYAFNEWSRLTKRHTMLSRKYAAEFVGCLHKTLNAWHAVAERGRHDSILTEFRKSAIDRIRQVEEWCTQELEKGWGHAQREISRVAEMCAGVGEQCSDLNKRCIELGERCSSLGEAVQRARDEARGHAECHTESHAELREAVSTMERGHVAVMEQHGELREAFDTVLGLPSRGTARYSLASRHLTADPADFIADIMRLKCGGSK